MTMTLFAQPYDIEATGFYFESIEDYTEKAKALRNRYGDPVEEFEIQFIDGETIDCELAKALGLSQATVADFLELAEQFVEEGLYGEIPEHLQFYIDYDAIARDLGMDHTEITIAGERLIYRAS